jgi:heme-degrading monooxygenase HmoA
MHTGVQLIAYVPCDNMSLSSFLVATCTIAFLLVPINQAVAFSPANMRSRVSTSSSSLGLVRMSATTTTYDVDLLPTKEGLMRRDRYIATNRFAVRTGQQAKFDKRWASRTSRLATLPGFKYFHLMRRVTLNPNDDKDTSLVYDGGDDSDEAAAQENYVSFTIWQKKSDFSAWRKGDAFKEAHGGTSIGAFLTTMVSSAMVLRGAPRPAFYDALYQESAVPTNVPEIVDGWRSSVQADGIHTLPPECFVCLEKFFVPMEHAASFEKMKQWQNRQKSLRGMDGFVSFSLMRRDGQAKGHGVGKINPDTEPTYVATTIFQDRPSFEKWNLLVAALTSTESAVDFCTKAPNRVFYEGTLVITNQQGA